MLDEYYYIAPDSRCIEGNGKMVIKTDRQTDRQTGRQAGRQAGRQTDKQLSLIHI